MKDEDPLTAQLFGIMAHPVGHSLSPHMHQMAFAALSLPHTYHAFDIHPDHLQTAITSIKVLGMKGVNISIPHKEEVLPLLDEVDTEAQAIGAVNTIVHTEQGSLKGYNTDGLGYVKSLQEETNIELTQTDVLLIGAGGAAKAIGVYLLKSGCPRVTIVNRTEAKAAQLVRHLQQYAQDQNISAHIGWISWKKEIDAIQESYNVYIQTTPIGMWPNTQNVPISLHHLQPHTIVSDIVYNPLKTSFIHRAEQQGATIHPGLGMFVYQGALAFEYFTGYEPPVKTMREAVLDKLNRRR